VGHFDAATADRQISRLFASEFGQLSTKCRGSQCCTASIKGKYTASASPFSSCHAFDSHCCITEWNGEKPDTPMCWLSGW